LKVVQGLTYGRPLRFLRRRILSATVGNKFYSLINVESHHSKWEEFRKLAKKNSATEECSFLLKRRII
jgi:hypothetical protein